MLLNSLWRNAVVAFGILLLTTLYLLAYFHNPALPWPSARYPEGWWGWFDQSKYLESARALAAGDLTATHHWYPFGYALIGTPFAWMGNQIYLLPDLLCLLVFAFAFLSFARALRVPTSVAVVLMIGTTMFPAPIRAAWAEPWNTTLATALIWSALALSARLILVPDAPNRDIHRLRYVFLLGAILAFIPVARPTDALVAAMIAAACILTMIVTRKIDRGEVLAAILSAVCTLTLCGALYCSIYGAHASDYMVQSATMGFRAHMLWWKTYLLLITPRPWFPDGTGILETMPWVFLGLCGIALCMVSRQRRENLPYLVLAVMTTSYSLLFFSYVDLIPAGLWRYNNIHYFKWVFPALGLLAWYALSRLFSRDWKRALAVMLVLFALSGIRILPVSRPIATSGAMMVQLHEPPPAWPDVYFRDFQIDDSRGSEKNINDFRSLPDSQGERWIALGRPFGEGPHAMMPHTSLPAPSKAWGMYVTFRPDPCWLPPHACRAKLPVP